MTPAVQNLQAQLCKMLEAAVPKPKPEERQLVLAGIEVGAQVITDLGRIAAALEKIADAGGSFYVDDQNMMRNR